MGLLDFEGDAKIFSKSQSPLRWLILFLACVMMIGNYYCYDNPAALKTQIQAQMGNPSDYETMYSLLYTVYSIPNVILPFFGGYFVDLLGVRLCLLVFAGLILGGQVIFAIGLSAKSWPIMFVGRVIYGFGGESLSVGNSALLAQWFAGKELAFAFGLNLSIARLGSVINNLVSPQMSNMSGVVFALWFGALVCGISFFCTAVIVPLDKGLDIMLEKSERMREPLLADVVENSDANDAAMKQAEILDRDDSLTGINSTKGGKGGKDSDAGLDDGDENTDVDIWAVKDFEIPFFVLTLSCVVVYGK
jgi:MFS family permease